MTPAEEVMDALRQKQMRRIVSFENETRTHLMARLTCDHGVIFPIVLSPEGMKKFLLAADIDCRECAP